MAVIITAHIATSSRTCGQFHAAVIIQAAAPFIGPYMSRAISTIQSHAAMGTAPRTTSDHAPVVQKRGFEQCR